MRRSNAQRSAETRRRLIKAAITCLHVNGYAATTTVAIADKAKVSRGAMLHQFPTKVDLMLGVAQHVIEDEFREYIEARSHHSTAYDKLMAVIDLTTEMIARPATMAVVEITVAARTDPALAERFIPLAARTSDRHREAFRSLAEQSGVKDAAIIDAIAQLYLATVRGMSIELLVTTDRSHFDASLAMIKNTKATLVNMLGGSPDADLPN